MKSKSGALLVVHIESELRDERETMLGDTKTIIAFVETAVRRAFSSRAQPDFFTRGERAWKRYLMARPRLNRKIVWTSVSLDERMFREVAQLASQNDVSVAWLVRKAVAELLNRRRQDLESHLALIAPTGKSDEAKT